MQNSLRTTSANSTKDGLIPRRQSNRLKGEVPATIDISSESEDDLEKIVANLPKTTTDKKRKEPPSPQTTNIRTKSRRISGAQHKNGTVLAGGSVGQQKSQEQPTDFQEEEARVPGAAFDLTFEFELKVQTMTKGGKSRTDKPKGKITRDTKIHSALILRISRISLSDLRSKLVSHVKESVDDLVWDAIDYRPGSKAASHDRTFPTDVPSLNSFLAEMSRSKTKRCIIVLPPVAVGKEVSEDVEVEEVPDKSSVFKGKPPMRDVRNQYRDMQSLIEEAHPVGGCETHPGIRCAQNARNKHFKLEKVNIAAWAAHLNANPTTEPNVKLAPTTISWFYPGRALRDNPPPKASTSTSSEGSTLTALSTLLSTFANIQPAAPIAQPPAPAEPLPLEPASVYPAMAECYRHALPLEEFCTQIGLEDTMGAKLTTLGFRVGDTTEDVLAISDQEWRDAGVSTLAKRRVLTAIRECWAQKVGQ